MRRQVQPEKLREARERLGVTTRVLSSRMHLEFGLSISHVAISKMERGLLGASEGYLNALVGLTSLSADWFQKSDQPMVGIRYRALATQSVSAKSCFEAAARPWVRLFLEVFRISGEQDDAKFRVRAAADETAKALANRLRSIYGFGEYPIPSLARVLENSGTRVIQLTAERGIDAFSAFVGDQPVVVVNSELPADRMRLTLAHELAHVLYGDLNDNKSESARIESRAFEFASCFLVPDEPLREAFKGQSMVKLLQYKERYGVSLAAMIYRGKRLGLLSDSVYRKLWRQFTQLGWRKQEPGKVAPDRPLRMEALLDQVVQQRKSTYKELAHLAGLPEPEIRSRILQAMNATDPVYDHQAPDVFRFTS